MKKSILSLAIAGMAILGSCSSDEETVEATSIPTVETAVSTSTFRITLRNAINFLSADTIGDAPLTTTGETYVTTFKAPKGTYLSFANMFAQSNDWFFAPASTGIKLWDNMVPLTGDISDQIIVWDAGSEEEEDFLTDFPNTMFTAPNQSEPNSGPADDNNNVRNTGRNIRNYLTANLAYDASSKEFTLTITKANREALHNPGFITPGILVIHTQDNALFVANEPLLNNGLEGLAEDGSPAAIYEWFTEVGSTGAPLRLSSSYSVLSPAVAYVHDGEQTPLFTNGEAITTDNGLEELAEDGSNEIAFNYLNAMDNVTAMRTTTPATPGESMVIEIEAAPGQRLNFATMLISSNDWFISNNQAGITLFNEDGTPKSSFDISKNYLYDAGTEVDQIVGQGNGQPMGGNVAVADDADTTVRRVRALDDVQFGKGIISSPAGVTQYLDERGGYNLIEVTVALIN